MANPFTGLIAGAAAFPANPEHGLVQLVERPSSTLETWDRLLEKRRLSGLCALDAHGIPPYAPEMRALALRTPSGPVNRPVGRSTIAPGAISWSTAVS